MSEPKSRMSNKVVILAALSFFACVACRSTPVDPPDAATSPQARAEPAPLASLPALAAAGVSPGAGPDAGPGPQPLRSGEALWADLPTELAHEPGGRDARGIAGYALQATVRSGEGPSAPRAAEVNGSAIDAARRKTEARIAVEVAQTRARFVLSGGFVLSVGDGATRPHRSLRLPVALAGRGDLSNRGARGARASTLENCAWTWRRFLRAYVRSTGEGPVG